MTRPRIEDIEVPASASDGDVPTVDTGVLVYAPPPGAAPTGPAGGVLSGTYPNPGFAADMATQAELDAHITDATDAHDASAISVTPTGGVVSTDVQAAIAELDAEIAAIGGGGTAGALSTRYQPMVVVTAGVPELLYDSANNLVMTEVPNP